MNRRPLPAKGYGTHRLWPRTPSCCQNIGIELAALAGILGSVVTRMYGMDFDACIRSVLNLLQKQFGITTAQATTLDMWESWGQNAEVMRTMPTGLGRYAAAVNYHVGHYLERLNRRDQERIRHLLLPALRSGSATGSSAWRSTEQTSVAVVYATSATADGTTRRHTGTGSCC